MKRKVIYKVNIMALLVFLPVMLYMCKNSKYSDFIINDAEGIQEPITPTVTTNEVTDITITSARCGGNIVDDGGADITARGVCWSTNQNPTITGSHTTDGSGTGSYTSNITGLNAGTTYYVRAYATNSEGTSYGSQKSFNTTNGQINGYDYVDLGLPSGLKWATCNVGASSPSEYGNYYAWGEVEPKESYTQQNCLTWGQEIGDISGNPQYDAARANWGGTWRMPTKIEFDELINNCTWTWTNEGGNNGWRVTGPNGNSIFFPAAGYRYGTSLYNAGSYGYCWAFKSRTMQIPPFGGRKIFSKIATSKKW